VTSEAQPPPLHYVPVAPDTAGLPRDAPPGRKRSRLPLILGIAGAPVVLLGGGGVALAIWQHNKGPGTATSAAAWRDGGGEALTSKLIIDQADTVAHPGEANRKTACTHMKTDVEAAEAYLRIPDHTAQATWAQALSYFASAAQDCLTAIDKRDPVRSSKADDEMFHGGALLLAVTRRLDQLIG
jgi:hypothetical protein